MKIHVIRSGTGTSGSEPLSNPSPHLPPRIQLPHLHCTRVSVCLYITLQYSQPIQEHLLHPHARKI